MNRNILMAGAVLIVVLAGALFLLPPRASAPTNDAEEASLNEGEQAETEDNKETNDENATTTETTGDGVESIPPITKTPPKPVATSPTPPPAPTPTPEASFPYNATVIFDGGRFIPDYVTIIVGGTVRFVNVSDIDMWIATDNHPTHDRYPIKDEDTCFGNLFDQCESVEKGGSWSFTFTRTGGFGYHNHKAAQYTGDINVLTVEEYNKKF